MKYKDICEGRFLQRPNRFVAHVEINGNEEKVHVKNTGRCRELLIPGTKVYLEDFSDNMRKRKLKYSLIAVEKTTASGVTLVNIDSQAPNKVTKEALEGNLIVPEGLRNVNFVKGEYCFGDSRIDFYIADSDGNEALMEVKGATLEKGGIAQFPDAPTERGVKHIEELIKARKQGYRACILFVIQMKGVELFTPNYDTHAHFGETLKKAKEAGVEILAYDCNVNSDMLKLDKQVQIKL